MNQEFLTFLHLVSMRVGYVRGDAATDVDGNPTIVYTYQETTLSQLDGLLAQVVVASHINEVRDEIVAALSNVFDFEDQPHAMVEEKALVAADGTPLLNGTYLRVPRGCVLDYVDQTTGLTLKVPGVILSVMRNVMRTDGVVCDAILGRARRSTATPAGCKTRWCAARSSPTTGRQALVETANVWASPRPGRQRRRRQALEPGVPVAGARRRARSHSNAKERERATPPTPRSWTTP